MKRATLILILLTITLIGCEGPAGPQGPPGQPGPAGPTGPQGPTGESSAMYVLSGTTSAEALRYDLPVEAGTLAAPPTLSCLVRQPGSRLWAVLFASSSLGECGLEPRTTNPAGPLRVYLRNTADGWEYQITVGY